MKSRHVVRHAADMQLEIPPGYEERSSGFRAWTAVDTDDAVHTGFAICELTPEGHIDRHVHSFEETFFIVDGEVQLETDEGIFLLRPGDYGLLTVGTPHRWRGSGDRPARWAQMLAPQPRSIDDTFFDARQARDTTPLLIDPRDPRTRSFGHIDPENMDASKQGQEFLARSASMRTALLVYSGITVKMMVDSDLGAELSTMFMVQYEPNGKAGAHDHPLEETYFILDGEVDATFDDKTYRLHAGDVAWAGVGCKHAFFNPGQQIVRWLETQAPQPPGRHSYRFARDWEYLKEVIAQE
jgi:quercetin dioxygenase-like cupin family protein